MNREQLEETRDLHKGWRSSATVCPRQGEPCTQCAKRAAATAARVPALLDEIDRRPVVNVDRLRELAGALNRMQAKHPHANYVGYGDAILDAIGEEPGYMGRTTAEGGTSKGSSEDRHVVAVLDAAIVLGQSMPRFVEGSGPWDYSTEEVALGRAVDALLASRHTLRDQPAGGVS